MKNKVLILFVTAIFIGAVAYRIYFVNHISYHNPERELYNIGDTILYNGLEISVSGYSIYSGDEFNAAYEGQFDFDADQYDLLFDVSLKNPTDEAVSFNAVQTGMMYDNKYGGMVNPLLYQFFNPDTPGTLEIAPNSERTVTLAFPYESDTLAENSRFIISLYPRKISVLLDEDK